MADLLVGGLFQLGLPLLLVAFVFKHKDGEQSDEIGGNEHQEGFKYRPPFALEDLLLGDIEKADEDNSAQDCQAHAA